MKGDLWSLRNKLEDLMAALRDEDLTRAKLYAFELEVRLRHAEAAWTDIETRRDQ